MYIFEREENKKINNKKGGAAEKTQSIFNYR